MVELEQAIKSLINRKSIRQALRAWHSSPTLGQHPLIQLNIVEAQRQNSRYPDTLEGRGRALRDVLHNAIRELSPVGLDPPDDEQDINFSDPRWRYYVILNQEYIHGRNPDYIASQLAIETRTLRNAKTKALDLLIDILSQREGNDSATFSSVNFEPGHLEGKRNLLELGDSYSDRSPIETPQLTSYFVQPKQLEATIVNKLVAQQVRTLVLWGPGGAGKTTLAVWIATLLAKDFPDGIIWVDCQENSTVTSIQDAIANSMDFSLDVPSIARRSRKLHSRLRNKRCLLVLDNLWIIDGLRHLRLGSMTSRLLITTRDSKVANLLEAPTIQVVGLANDEALSLLSQWAGFSVKEQELVLRLRGLPLALRLAGAQLQDGIPLSELLANFRQNQIDLSILDLDDPQTQFESVVLCFDVSYQYLSSVNKLRFAQLGYFASGKLIDAAITAVWAVDTKASDRTLKQLYRFAFLERSGKGYRLHPLLHAYARQHLSSVSNRDNAASQRHAAWYIRYALCHPSLMAESSEVPNLNQAWADVVAGVQWATKHDILMAAQALLLAHTERPALLEAVGRPLIKAAETYLNNNDNRFEQAVLYERLGDLYLLNGDIEAGLACFEKSSTNWIASGDDLAASYIRLRIAGAYLLRQDYQEAAENARQAQLHLQISIPLTQNTLAEARRLFYWFEMIYDPLIRWEGLLEADVAAIASLAKETQQPILEARGLSIYCSWATTRHVPRSLETQLQGRRLALEAYVLWRACKRKDRADDEVSFTKYRLTNRYSWRTAARFARRRSYTTPRIDMPQGYLTKNVAIRWWLSATEEQRIQWLSRMLPRYLSADNRPYHPETNEPLSVLQPDSEAYRWVDDILNVSMLGNLERRLARGAERPQGHFLTGPEWRVLSGQKVLPLVKPKAKVLVQHYLEALDEKLD